MPGVVVSEQLDLLRRYGADLVFPPGDGHLPRAIPLSVAGAVASGSSDDRHGG